MHLREAVGEDAPLLVSLLVDAVNWAGDARLSPEQVMADPALRRYVDGWMRETDDGVVATGDDGAALGAVWWRRLPADAPGYGFVSVDVPEVSMGVLAGHRGRGVGGALLLACVERARASGCPALSLSVEDGNDAARALYERRGFVVVGRTGQSDTMLLALATG